MINKHSLLQMGNYVVQKPKYMHSYLRLSYHKRKYSNTCKLTRDKMHAYSFSPVIFRWLSSNIVLFGKQTLYLHILTRIQVNSFKYWLWNVAPIDCSSSRVRLINPSVWVFSTLVPRFSGNRRGGNGNDLLVYWLIKYKFF